MKGYLEIDPEVHRMIMEAEKAMAGEKAERYCVDCQFMAADGSLICKRPVINLVTGQPWTLDLACHTERKSGGGCGVEGRFWKQRMVTMTNAAGAKLEVPAETFEPDRVMDRKYAEEDDGA